MEVRSAPPQAGHESKKDGVREMKKMSDDEVWEALYGDD